MGCVAPDSLLLVAHLLQGHVRMKVTDALTLFYRSNPSDPAPPESGVKPVPLIDKMSLHPGQLFRGEVLGTDGKGHLLLQIGGEIIATRTLVSMEAGQQAWVEVKAVGDSPIFALAQAKGAVHELLINIMDVRSAVLAQGQGETVVSPDFQVAPQGSSSISFVPKLPPLLSDGTLPRETLQLLKGLVALPQAEIPPLSEAKMQQLAPFLVPETGAVDLGRVVHVLQQTGRIPPVLSAFPSMRPLFIFSSAPDLGAAQPNQGTSPSVPPPSSLTNPEPRLPMDGAMPVASAAVSGEEPESPVPFITSDGRVVGHAVQLVRGLVESVSLAQSDTVHTYTELGKGFSDLVQLVLKAGNIPESIRGLEPMQRLLQAGYTPAPKVDFPMQATTADAFIQGFSDTTLHGKSLSSVQHNETVAKVLASLQGSEPKPELLRVLKQLVSALAVKQGAGEEEPDKARVKPHDLTAGLAKAASFFDSHGAVNREMVHAGQNDCVLVPCFFSGQSGWGEWMWSHEQEENSQGQTQEHLAFFLEMTNLGPVSIQVVLGEKSIAGQFSVADEAAYGLLDKALPALEARLGGLGYESQFSCRMKPVAIMQEIKDELKMRTGGAVPSSLVDIQA